MKLTHIDIFTNKICTVFYSVKYIHKNDKRVIEKTQNVKSKYAEHLSCVI